MRVVKTQRLTRICSLLLAGIAFGPLSGSALLAALDVTVKDADTGFAIMKDAAGYHATSGSRLKFTLLGGTAAPTWTFGDGATSPEAAPVHAYTSPTDAQFVATVASGSESKSVTVSVSGTLGSALTAGYDVRYLDDSAVDPLRVPANRALRFTARDAADRVVWDFGDGATATGSPVVHAFSAAGNFAVKLTVSRAGLAETTTPAPVRFTVLAPPDAPQWLIPGIAYTEGLSGALWQSDIAIFNPHVTEPMALSVAFLDARVALAEGEQPRWVGLTLAPLQSVTLVNVLSGAPFYRPRGTFGALVFRGDVIPATPSITARTYDAGAPGRGTTGLSNALMSTAEGIEAGSRTESALIGLRETANHYTNFGVANLKGDAASVEVRFTGADGRSLGVPVRFDLAPFGVVQLTHVLSAAPPAGAGHRSPVDGFTALVTLLHGTAVAPYATVIDNASKDPIFITPCARPSASYRLPGIVRSQGARGTVWRSDVVLFNPSEHARAVTVSFSYRAANGTAERRSVVRSVPLVARGSFELDDFVKQWLGLDEDDATSYAGSYVDIAPGDSNTEPLLVLGRTYNVQPTGDVGLRVPAFTPEDGASAEGSTRSLILSGLQSDDARRSNVALFLLPRAGQLDTDLSAEATVRIHDAAGRLLRSRPVRLTSLDSVVQLDDGTLFGGLTGNRENLTVIVDGISGGASVAAYATVIDQISGDGTFVPGQPAR
ncbi:MAG: PKD domain-containing protein [Thermoanaerobaculia bacterium]